MSVDGGQPKYSALLRSLFPKVVSLRVLICIEQEGRGFDQNSLSTGRPCIPGGCVPGLYRSFLGHLPCPPHTWLGAEHAEKCCCRHVGNSPEGLCASALGVLRPQVAHAL